MPDFREKSAYLRKWNKVLFAFLLRNKFKAAIAVVLLVLIISFSNIIFPAIVIMSLGVIATFSTSYKRIIRMPPAVELITFTTVIVSLAYGPVIGAIYGAVVSFTAEVMTNALDIFILTFVPSRAVVGLVAGLAFDMFNGNILVTGVSLSIMYNLIAQPFYIFLADVEMRMKSFFFLFLNIGSNFIWFAVLGRLAVNLLGIA
ncbi:hypothetical protein J4470_01480 [Candidatus Woesearchaeota archaeon]|nr:hypothetical protein [Candidatus Woesearchaeota archaeon]